MCVHKKYVNTIIAVTTGIGLKQLKRLVIRLHLLIPLFYSVYIESKRGLSLLISFYTMHLLRLRYMVRSIDGQHNNVYFDDYFECKTHMSVKINIFEHVNCACRTSDN